jgi:hypothetical protein
MTAELVSKPQVQVQEGQREGREPAEHAYERRHSTRAEDVQSQP